jgi:hypothetical protein
MRHSQGAETIDREHKTPALKRSRRRPVLSQQWDMGEKIMNP